MLKSRRMSKLSYCCPAIVPEQERITGIVETIKGLTDSWNDLLSQLEKN